MAAGITTSIRMPQDIRDLYETLAQATGRARNDLMVEALRVEGLLLFPLIGKPGEVPETREHLVTRHAYHNVYHFHS